MSLLEKRIVIVIQTTTYISSVMYLYSRFSDIYDKYFKADLDGKSSNHFEKCRHYSGLPFIMFDFIYNQFRLPSLTIVSMLLVFIFSFDRIFSTLQLCDQTTNITNPT